MAGISVDSSLALLSEPDASSSTGVFDHFEKSLHSSSVEHLENAAEIGVEFLQTLKSALAASTSMNIEARRWSQRVEDALAEKRPYKAVFAVLGGTGAGKSSIINAILDEDRLIPTNCVRACTASATEIAYNTSDDPDESYRAEVEFISSDEWVTELRALLGDIDDSSDDDAQASIRNPEADAAWAKITAVYPQISKEDILKSDIRDLLEELYMHNVLGTTTNLKATSAASLYSQLREFVDSRDKTGVKKMELWPLVKIVRVFIKAEALSTGAIIVDLPGTQDANAARAAVAAQYLKKATGFWIVAPIIRAVDDKTAKSLLGDAFKRQIKLDGNFSAITFVCSKTDGIVVSEARESLEINPPEDFEWDDDVRLLNEIEALQEEANTLRVQAKEEKQLMEDADDKAEHCEGLLKEIEKGNTVLEPSPSDFQKSKCRARKVGTRSRPRRAPSTIAAWATSGGSLNAPIDLDEESPAAENSETEPTMKLLTPEEAARLIDSFKSAKKHHRENKEEIEDSLEEIECDIEECQERLRQFEIAAQTLCIRARNEYAIHDIKRDFAEGLKELDDEAALERDQEGFDPSQDQQDYSKISASLPVFCCSSHAYQKSRKKSRRDHPLLDGFPAVKDTGIPQLRSHLMQSTEPARKKAAMQFLTKLARLIMSLKMWCLNGGTSLTEDEQKERQKLLSDDMEDLQKKLLTAAGDHRDELSMVLRVFIYDNLDRIAPRASEAAVEKAKSWGYKRDQGGMLYHTYQATCRRNGVFKGRSGPRDLNQELLEPVLKGIAAPWERVFLVLVPAGLRTFLQTCIAYLEKFRQVMISRKGFLEDSQSSAGLADQLLAHQAAFKHLQNRVTRKIRRLQREANRSFGPAIEQHLQPAYNECLRERGPGAQKRMVDYMVRYISDIRIEIFEDSTGAVRGVLEELCEEVDEYLQRKILGILEEISDDCRSALGGCDEKNTKALRAELSTHLAEIDTTFKGVLAMP